MSLEKHHTERRYLRRLAHGAGAGFALFIYLVVFSLTGDHDLSYGLMSVAGLSVGISWGMLWYIERRLS